MGLPDGVLEWWEDGRDGLVGWLEERKDGRLWSQTLLASAVCGIALLLQWHSSPALVFYYDQGFCVWLYRVASASYACDSCLVRAPPTLS